MTFDPAKPVQTECGGPAALLADDIDDIHLKYAFRYKAMGGSETVGMFYNDGTPHPSNFPEVKLVNIPRKAKVWVHFYRSDCSDDGWDAVIQKDNRGRDRDTISIVPFEIDLPEDL